jgi:hypothetical protein
LGHLVALGVESYLDLEGYQKLRLIQEFDY